MRLVQQAFRPGLCVWLIITSLTGVAYGRIKTPHIDELVDRANLIVIGKVESVQTTPPLLWRQIGITIILITSAAVLTFLLWKKKIAIAACLAVACLLVIPLFGIPFGMYGKVANLSVSSTIKGPPSPDNISVFYNDGFLCDVSYLKAGQEYLLFLRKISSGYTLSRYDWSVWAIKSGYAQTERNTWQNADPITIDELISRIKKIIDDQQIIDGQQKSEN